MLKMISTQLAALDVKKIDNVQELRVMASWLRSAIVATDAMPLSLQYLIFICEQMNLEDISYTRWHMLWKNELDALENTLAAIRQEIKRRTDEAKKTKKPRSKAERKPDSVRTRAVGKAKRVLPADRIHSRRKDSKQPRTKQRKKTERK